MIDVSVDRGSAPNELEWHPLLSEHAVLAACAQRLEMLLGSLAGGVAERSDRHQVQALLDEFRRRLFSHLASEEGAGLLERAALAEPRLGRRVEVLLREHGDLRARVAALAAAPVDAEAGAGWLRMHARFVDFRHLLHEHEQAENDVLHSAYLEDIGGRG